MTEAISHGTSRVRTTCQKQLRLAIYVLKWHLAVQARMFFIFNILRQFFWVLLLSST